MRGFAIAALGAAVIGTTCGTSPAHKDAIGCFADDQSDRVLTAKWSSRAMTPTTCAAYCAKESSGYAFYATQWGEECWCQDQNIELRHGEGTCDFPCSGDESIVCGGFDSFTLYELEGATLPASPTDDNYVGCFADDRHDRVLGAKTSSGQMTSEVCAAYCANESSRNKYYATQYGEECWCAPLVDLRHGEGTCDYACTGAADTTCGGFSAFDLFDLEVDLPSPPSEDYYLGCFADDQHDRVLEDKMSSGDMTLQVCEDFCVARDKPFFALQWGQECWCGGCELLDEGRDRYDRHGATACAGYPCTGETYRACGAFDAFSLYYRGTCEESLATDTPTEYPTAGSMFTAAPTATPTVFVDTAAPTIFPMTDSIVCEMILANVTAIPTPLGGSSLTVTTSPCEFDLAITFSIFTVEGDLLEEVAGEFVDSGTAQLTLPPLPMDTKVIAVLASSAAGGGMVGTFHLYGVNALFESPADGGDGRISFVTDPPSDLQLVWDPSFTSADSIEIVLVVVVEDAGEIQDVAVLGQQSNNGSCLILSTALDEFNLLENSFISFKIVEDTARPSARRLILSPVARWLLVGGVLVYKIYDALKELLLENTYCEERFPDDLSSRCQCFFIQETRRQERGAQLDAFDDNFRCPSTIDCILEAPPGLITLSHKNVDFSVVDLTSSDYKPGWKMDKACPFGWCSFDSAEGDRILQSCARLPYYDFDFYNFTLCKFHPRAEFCVRTDEATTSNGGDTTFGNQCCYDSDGNILADVTTGGGTVDKYDTLVPHAIDDLNPFNWCCGDRLDYWLCQLYIELRPVDGGDAYDATSDGYLDGQCRADPNGAVRTDPLPVKIIVRPPVSSRSARLEWACHDDRGVRGNAWAHSSSVDYTSAYGCHFNVIVSAPVELSAGIKCVAVVVAEKEDYEQVIVGGQEFTVSADGQVVAVDIDMVPYGFGTQPDSRKCCPGEGGQSTAVYSDDECCPDEELCEGPSGNQCYVPAGSICCSDGSVVDNTECCGGEEKCFGGPCYNPEDSSCCDGFIVIGTTCPVFNQDDGPKRGGSAGGDPHLRGYDNNAYDCHGQGEFVLTKATATDSEVQVRFQQWGVNPNPAVTVTTSVVAREGGSSVVQVTSTASGGVEVLVDGELYDEVAGAVTGLTLTETSSRVEIRFPSGLDVFVSTSMAQLLRVNTYAPLTLATTGLLGNNNGESGDDWSAANGEAVEFASPMRPTVTEGTNYCTTNWCTTQASSIFTYAEGEDHSTYDLCDTVYSAPVLPDVVPAAIVELCGDNADCTFDALLAGEAVGQATLEAEEADRAYQEQVGGTCPGNYFSSTGTPPCTACPAGETSGPGATACTFEGVPAEFGAIPTTAIAAAMLADAAGGFAGPGSFTPDYPGTLELTDESLGSVGVSGKFVRDDGLQLPSSASVFFYIDNPAQPDDFIRGQGYLETTDGELEWVVTDIPAGSSTLFLSFVITDLAQAEEIVEVVPAASLFAFNVSNTGCVPSLVITHQHEYGSNGLIVTEPGGSVVIFTRYGDVGLLQSVGGRARYMVFSGLDPDTSQVLGEYKTRVPYPISGKSRLTARVSGEVVWTEERDQAAFDDNDEFSVILTDYDPGCGLTTSF